MSHPAVAISRQDTYDRDALIDLLRQQFDVLGISPALFAGKRVVLKPNLLLGYAPERAATTHPAIVQAAAALAKEWGAADVLLAESSGGPYRRETINSVCRACGMTEGEEMGLYTINRDPGATDLHLPEGKASKMFHLLTPITEADVILNLCKLKTHALAQMTCGVKNLFGVIPGIEKFEMHARFPRLPDFFAMLTDLCLAVQGICPVITVCDAIDAMEGDGPSGGQVRHLGLVLSCADPFALDLAASAIIGMEGRVPHLRHAQERGLVAARSDELSYPLLKAESVAVDDFLPPRTNMKSKFDLIPSFLQPRPVINESKCVGCGKCIASCPAKAMEKRGRVAFIRKRDCIRCYCCQELCTLEAVDVYRHPILRLIQPRGRKEGGKR